MVAEFGNRVRIIDHPDTISAGLAGRVGTIHGFATPSLGYLSDPIVGEVEEDAAVAVQFDGERDVVWIVPRLLEFLDVGAGARVRVGDVWFVKEPGGTWERTREGDR